MKYSLRQIMPPSRADLSKPYLSRELLEQYVDIDTYRQSVKSECESLLEETKEECVRLEAEAKTRAYLTSLESIENALMDISSRWGALEDTLESTVLAMLESALEDFYLNIDDRRKFNFLIKKIVQSDSSRFAARWVVHSGKGGAFSSILESSDVPPAFSSLDVMESPDIGASELGLEFPGGAMVSVCFDSFMSALISRCKELHHE